MKIIIIGSIAAGVSAAARLAAAQRGAQITVYEKGGFYSCGTGGLPHYLCEDLDSLNKAIQAKETELNAQGITARLRHEVRGIDAAARKVTVCDLATGRVFEDHYDKLVLATGSSNRVPQVPGSDRVGVQTLKTVEDLIFLKEFVRTPYVRDIVILGGSWAGLEIAKSFLKLGRNVRIIEKEQQLLPQFDPEVSKLIQKELEAQGVQFNLGEQVRSFVKKQRRQHGCQFRARPQGKGKRQHQKRQRVHAHIGIAKAKVHHSPSSGAGSMSSPARRASK